jgi:hypothetical protein
MTLRVMPDAPTKTPDVAMTPGFDAPIPNLGHMSQMQQIHGKRVGHPPKADGVSGDAPASFGFTCEIRL